MRNSLMGMGALCLLAVTPGEAAAQAMDGAGQDAGAGQFEGTPPRPPSVISRLREGPRQQANEDASRPLFREETDQNASLDELLSESKALQNQIARGNRLLEGLGPGRYLFTADGVRFVMTESEMVARMRAGQILVETTEFDPLGAGDAEPTIQLWRSRLDQVSQSGVERLRGDIAYWQGRRDQLLRELDKRRREAMAEADRPGNSYDPNASYSAAACTLPHRWRFNVPNMGSSTWTVDASGRAAEAGLGGARGTASFSSGSIRIDWQTGAYAGYLQMSLDADCNGSGTLIWTRSPTGPNSFPATFESLGGGN